MSKEMPKHRRIYAALRHDILTGKYSTDGKFPSEGMLMRRFGVSRITIRRAMGDLKNEGFLEGRSGSGTYLSALARHATGMIGLVIPDYSSSQFFHRLGDELVQVGKSAELLRECQERRSPHQLELHRQSIQDSDLEQLVGEIWDETDKVEEEIQVIEDGVVHLDGDLPVSDLVELMDWDEAEFDFESETVGGWCIEMLESFPEAGSSFRYLDSVVTILEVEERRVLLVEIRKASEDEEQ